VRHASFIGGIGDSLRVSSAPDRELWGSPRWSAGFSRVAALAVAAILLLTACSQPGSKNQGSSEHSSAPVTPAATLKAGIGVSRAAVMAAVDAAIAPKTLVWGPEARMRDGTPEVIGRPADRLSRAGVRLVGSADDLIAIEVGDDPATTPTEAHLAFAVVHVAVPEAEEWLRAGLIQPPGFQHESFDGITLVWGPNVIVTEAHESILEIIAGELPPSVTRTPGAVAPSAS